MLRARGPKILIISSDTGGGHRSAAAAIVAGVQKFWEGDSHAVRVVRAVEESHHLSAKLVAIYNWVLRNKRSEEHTSELQSLRHLVCRLLLEKKKKTQYRLTNLHSIDDHAQRQY